MKQNRVVCSPGPGLLLFIFRFEYLISGPKSFRDFRETGPRAGHKITGEERKSMTLTCTPSLLSLVFCITLTLFPQIEEERNMYRALGTKRFYY